MTASAKLTATQVRALAAMTKTRTLVEAAKQAGCSEGTLRRWLRSDPRFQAAWREARAALVDDAIGQAQRAATLAVVTLHHLMTTAQSDSAKVAAAKILVEIAVKAVERDQFEERLRALTQTVEDLRAQHHL